MLRRVIFRLKPKVTTLESSPVEMLGESQSVVVCDSLTVMGISNQKRNMRRLDARMGVERKPLSTKLKRRPKSRKQILFFPVIVEVV